MSKAQEAIRLIQAGHTAREIQRELNYSTDYVYELAKWHGLKLTKPAEKKAERIRELSCQGESLGKIAKALGMTVTGVGGIIRKYNIPIRKEDETRKCEVCGTEFTTAKDSGQKYCSTQCGRKVWRKTKPDADDAGVAEMVAKYEPEWEYIGGYTGSEGSAVVRHKCGFTTRKSCVTIRHRDSHMRCDLCEERERQEREKRAATIKEVAKFYKPTKQHKQTEMQECPVCGCFFYNPRAKYCSNECAKEPIKHYQNMKKERRRKRARTEESKNISLRKLYDRDSGVCWICGGLCDYTADRNADNYPSIDHVVPIAHGGRDEWKNIRLAHRLCNSLRGSGERAADPE